MLTVNAKCDICGKDVYRWFRVMIAPDSSGCADIGDMRDLIGFDDEVDDGCAERQICMDCMRKLVETASKVEWNFS